MDVAGKRVQKTTKAEILLFLKKSELRKEKFLSVQNKINLFLCHDLIKLYAKSFLYKVYNISLMNFVKSYYFPVICIFFFLFFCHNLRCTLKPFANDDFLLFIKSFILKVNYIYLSILIKERCFQVRLTACVSAMAKKNYLT